MRPRTFLTFICFSLVVMFADTELVTHAQESFPKVQWEQVAAGKYTGITWSPDGNSIAFGNSNGTQVFIFDLKNKKIETEINLSLPATSLYSPLILEWSPDGNHIAVARNRVLYLINIRREPLVQQYPDLGATDIRWINDSLSAVFDSAGYIHLIDVAASKIVRLIEIDALGEYIYPAFDWNPVIGLFAAPLYTSTIGFWDISGEIVTTLVRTEPTLRNALRSDCLTSDNLTSGANRDIRSMRWANDGYRLAVAIEYRIIICTPNRALTNYAIITLPAIPDPDFDPSGMGSSLRPPFLITWSPDDRWLLSSASIAGDCWIAIFDSKRAYELHQIIEDEVCFEDWRWSPDASHLAVSGYDGVWVGSIQ